MGIQLGSNFDLNAGLPLDSREIVADITERDAIVSRYEGLRVYVLSEAKNYQLKGGTTNLDWVEQGDGAGGGTADDTEYIAQGYSAFLGESVDFNNVGDALDAILDLQYLGPLVSFTVSGSGTVREKGDEVTAATMTATITKRSDDIASVEYFVDGVSYASEAAPNPEGGVETQGWTGSFDDNTTFRVDVTDDGTNGGPTTVSGSRTFNFVYPYYSGIGAASLTAAQVAALTKDVRMESNSLNKNFGATSGEVYYFAYPASYGTLNSILDENGFETIADWTLRVENITGLDTTAQSYNIYEFNNVVTSPATNYTFAQ